MIILKATEKASLHPLSLEHTFLEKPERGGQIQIDLPSPALKLKGFPLPKNCFRPDSAPLIVLQQFPTSTISIVFYYKQ